MFWPVVAIIRFYHSTHLRLFCTVRVGGVFDEEISTSKTMLEHSTSILGVPLNNT